MDKFKNGELDLLVVRDMLLTGFDAPRLKKLYMGRVVREHKLLQTLARVNRPYGNWKYGHVVDFADIRKTFDAANAAYLEELKNELGDDWSHFDALFHKPEEIHATVAQMKNYLWKYCPENLAYFEQILDSADKKELQELHRTLAEARELKASIIGGGHYNFDGSPCEGQGLGAKIASCQKTDIRYRWKETPGKEKAQLFQHQSNEVFARNVASFRKNSKNLEKKTCIYLKFCQTVLVVA